MINKLKILTNQIVLNSVENFHIIPLFALLLKNKNIKKYIISSVELNLFRFSYFIQNNYYLCNHLVVIE